MKEIKYSVQAVILNDKGEVLSVSRKDDHNDAGLPGGKVDPDDLSPENAIWREVMEETGLNINMVSADMIFAIHKDGYMSYTYLIKSWKGDIQTDEPHVVKWTNFQEIMNGSFGRYNTLVSESLLDMGVKYKRHPDPKGTYVFQSSTEGGDGEPYVMVSPIYDKEGNGEWDVYSWNEDQFNDFRIMNHGQSDFGIGDLGHGAWEVHKGEDVVTTLEEVDEIMVKMGFIKDKFAL